MKKSEFGEMVLRLSLAFPGAITDNSKTTDVWFSILEPLEFKKVQTAVNALIAETESFKFGTNLGAVIKNRVSPVITTATIENHLNMAMALSRSPTGNHFDYLKKINPRLLDLCENADLFSRDLPTESAGFRVREISRQYLEEKENQKRGFEPPIKTEQKSLPEPRKTIVDLSVSERQANLDRVREITGKLFNRANT